MDNMTIYEKTRSVPENAKKTINGGKLSGYTDINPMWRIKMLTEIFGPAGLGWYTDIRRTWQEEGNDGKVAAFCEIDLYVKYGDEWSKPIRGLGGSMFVNIFNGRPDTSDECYKMAYTDAISVACKALGFGADVYGQKYGTKFDCYEEAAKTSKPEEYYCIVCGTKLPDEIKGANGKIMSAKRWYHGYGGMCVKCYLRNQAGESMSTMRNEYAAKGDV